MGGKRGGELVRANKDMALIRLSVSYELVVVCECVWVCVVVGGGDAIKKWEQ